MSERRLYRVSLCVMIFGEIEIEATDGRAAEASALDRCKDASRCFQTAPAAHRVEVRRPIDPREPAKGFQWHEVPRGSE